MRSYAAEECICVRLRMTGKPATTLRENFRGVMSKFASRTRNLKRENVVKILMMQGNVMYKQLTNNLMCKQLRNMNKK